MAIEALWLLGGGITLAVFALLGVIPRANIGAFYVGSRRGDSRPTRPKPANKNGGDSRLNETETPPLGDR